MIEIWKDIEGFEGVYQISNFGRLKSFKRIKNTGYILSNINKKGDYFSVVLTSIYKIRYVRIHILVAETFIPNPENKKYINHKDLNKQNNHIDNLEWCTARENIIHAMKHTNMTKAMNHYNSIIRPKKIKQFNLNNEFIAIFNNSIEASKMTGVCSRNILQVASKDEYKPGLIRKQAGGFIWKFE